MLDEDELSNIGDRLFVEFERDRLFGEFDRLFGEFDRLFADSEPALGEFDREESAGEGDRGPSLWFLEIGDLEALSGVFGVLGRLLGEPGSLRGDSEPLSGVRGDRGPFFGDLDLKMILFRFILINGGDRRLPLSAVRSRSTYVGF